MSNVYRTVIDNLGMSEDSQGKEGYLYLMLRMLQDYENLNPTADTHANPYRELLQVRLADYADTHAVKSITQLIGSRTENRGDRTWG